MEFDFERWDADIHEANSVNEIDLSWFAQNSRSLIEVQNPGSPLHVLVGNLEIGKSLIVGFSGALSKRNQNIKPPFFSFLSLAKDLNLPFLLISDPSLYHSNDLKLGWYAGNHKYLNLQSDIASLIDKVSTEYQLTPILSGGSGGGFASLAVSTLMTVKHKVFVWNPQTSIKKYYPRFVREYVYSSFPTLKGSDIENAFEYLDSQDIITDVTKKVLNDSAEILYIQNYSDTHTVTHATPFIEGQGLTIDENSTIPNLFSTNSKAYVLIADWGEGHIEPSREVIKSILTDFKFNNPTTSVLHILKKFEKDFNVVLNSIELSH